ncbi:MAG: class I SAM-dependent methyltransferase [Actinomycetota bacterium]|nr:class I SAM-dependent methyltransferase [Actinomycetota bacterium]
MDGGDAYGGAVGSFYSFYIERPRLGRLVGRALWGSDFRLMYRSLEGLGHLPWGATVLDAACGAGLVFSWLDPSRRPRYVGVDDSPAMLERARRRARRLGFADVEFHLSNVESLPLPDAVADVCLLYNALHCFRHPQAALDEILRCAKPGALSSAACWCAALPLGPTVS